MTEAQDRARSAERNAPLPRRAGAGKMLYLDAPSGLAGDMLVAALLDLGVPLAPIEAALGALPLDAVVLRHTYVDRSGIRARRFEVGAPAPLAERTHASIDAMLRDAPLLEGVRDRARRAFSMLADAEAEVHGVDVADVHFHEVGAIDSIVDVVAFAAALDYLGAELVCSPLPLGHGTVRTRHGILPLPAPATLLCLRGVPTYDGDVEAELVTPTGACLVASSTSRFERWPPMRMLRAGWGAGSRELADRANVVRAVLAEEVHGYRYWHAGFQAAFSGSAPASECRGVYAAYMTRPSADVSPDQSRLGSRRQLAGSGNQVPEEARETLASEMRVLETNLDDATPELVAHALERLHEEGARDAWTTPLTMKKGRAGVMVSVLADAADAERLARVLMGETPTLGVRSSIVTRWERPRRMVLVSTELGTIPVKIADGDGLPRQAKPEHDACAAAARAHGCTLRDVLLAVLLAVERDHV